MGGQGLKALQQGHGLGVALVDGFLDVGLVQGDEGKLDGDEETGAQDQQQAQGQQQPFHLVLHRPVGGCASGGGSAGAPKSKVCVTATGRLR